MKNLFFSLLLTCCAHLAISQSTISGIVSDTEGTPIPGAIVEVLNSPFKKMTNLDGQFVISKVPNGTITLCVRTISYEEHRRVIVVQGDVTDIFISLNEQVLKGVTILPAVIADDVPMASQMITQASLEKVNLGQDLPYLLQYTPSMVVTSDAGTGIGYTGMRIRGSDASRINVTFNGIPINDSEGQGVFWVNTPDLSSSASSITIQRGVGTSTNGAGAFGATVDVATQSYRDSAYGEVNNSYGSFNTRKHNVLFGTGLINNHWSFDGRISSINSDGFVDRATSDLKSYYLSGGYYGDKTSVQAITFAGKERTYQSWWGTPEAVINEDRDALDTHYWNNYGSYSTYEDSINLYDSGREYNYYTYENEVDNYNQDHYQLHVNHDFSSKLTMKISGHYTYGRGYFEQFKRDEVMADYGYDPITFTDPGDTIFIPNPFIPGDTLFYDVNGDTTFTIDETDLIRRRWLDNHFYGSIFNLRYDNHRYSIDFGGGWNQYQGDHFGEVIWAQYAPDGMIYDKYYDNSATKTDGNLYIKSSVWITEGLRAYVDLQGRQINYTASGIDADGQMIDVDTSFMFFNPKGGLTYRTGNHRFMGSYAIANREPVRNDFIDAPSGQTPGHETLNDLELGYNYNAYKWKIGLNAYYMMYKNQLVLTGALNDVGSPIRTNVDNSFRRGLELYAAVNIFPKLSWNGNVTLSENKIDKYNEVIYDYTNGYDVIETEYANTDIAFSPNIIAASIFSYRPAEEFEVAISSKYVGEQFLDNTSENNKKLEAYFVNDLRLSYSKEFKSLKSLTLSLMVNNLFNELYSSNGYTYSYIYVDKVTENFLYPQAGTNFLVGLNLKF